MGIVCMAQAAALLLAVGLSWRSPLPVSVPHPVTPDQVAAARVVPSLDSELDIEGGQVPLIRSEGASIQVIDIAAFDSANGEDPWFDFYNRVESTNAMVAMAE
jgi:hypothetical protein